DPQLVRAAFHRTPGSHRAQIEIALVRQRLLAIVTHMSFRSSATIAGLDPEDVIQIGLMRAYRSLHLFRGDSAFGTWVTRIALNYVLELKKTVRARVESVTEEVSIEIAGPTSDDPIERAETASQIAEAIQQLPDNQREVFLLHYELDFSHEEISKRLGLTKGSVKTLAFRARRSIRAALLAKPEFSRRSA